VGGRVQIRFKPVDSFAQVTINETGRDISEEILPYLFDLFPPANGPIASEYDAFGLGLGTTRQLIEMHGGTVRAANLGGGEGASFIVNLPLIPLSSALPQSNSDRPELTVKRGCSLKALPRLDGVRILLIEEDSEMSDLVTSALTQCGADTKSLDAAIALNAIEHWHADILISDLRMPSGVSHKLISKVSALKSEPGEKVSPMRLPARAVVKYWMRALPEGSQIAVKIPFATAALVMNAAKCQSNVL
jgi:CheY-like chemotaxis protein